MRKSSRAGGASANNSNGGFEFPAAGIFLERFQNAHPNGGDAAGDGDTFIDHQIEDAFRIDAGAGKNQARTEHGCCKRNAPGVGMEHGRDGKNGVGEAHAKDFRKPAGEGMQDQGAVGVDDSFGKAGGAGGEAHGGAVVFVDLRITEIVGGVGEQFFAIQEAVGDIVRFIGCDDDVLEGSIVAEFFVEGEKHVVNDEEAVVGLLGDSGDFVGMEAEIEGMEDAAAAGHAEKGFEMAGVVPHHGGDAVAALHSEFSEGGGQAAGAAIEFAEASASDGLVRLAGNDFGPGEDFAGALEDGGEREGKIHHGAAHRGPRVGMNLGAS